MAPRSAPKWTSFDTPPHPGRQAWEVGVTDLVYRPEEVYYRLKGIPFAPEPANEAMLKGSILHHHLLRNAPYGNLWVRMPLSGTDRFVAGHIDYFDPVDRTFADLKTSDRYKPTPAMVEKWHTQVGLYGYCLTHGEVHHNGEWLPAHDVIGDPPKTGAVHFWGAGGKLEWYKFALEGDDLQFEVEASYSWACRTYKEMLAGTWRPTEGAPDVVQSDVKPVSDAAVAELLSRLGDAKRKRDESTTEYDSLRATLFKGWPDAATKSLVHGSVMATFSPARIEKVLDVPTTEALLTASGLELAKFVETRVVTSEVVNEEALTKVLGDLPRVDVQRAKGFVSVTIRDDEG